MKLVEPVLLHDAVTHTPTGSCLSGARVVGAVVDNPHAHARGGLFDTGSPKTRLGRRGRAGPRARERSLPSAFASTRGDHTHRSDASGPFEDQEVLVHVRELALVKIALEPAADLRPPQSHAHHRTNQECTHACIALHTKCARQRKTWRVCGAMR